jgi:hypothetical protein
MVYEYSASIEHGACMYEQALDQDLECFYPISRHRSQGPGGGFPFLFAALRHDESAIVVAQLHVPLLWLEP